MADPAPCKICSQTERLSRGLCNRCYQRHYQRGDLDTVANKSQRSFWSYPIGHRYTDDDGYIRIRTQSGTKFEHRAVMAQVLGRELKPGENVHHKNGDRTDNSPGNLELWLVKQPKGCRVSDLIEYVVDNHLSDVLRLIEQGKLNTDVRSTQD